MRIPAVIILLTSALMADPTATLTGRVTDPTGAVMHLASINRGA